MLNVNHLTGFGASTGISQVYATLDPLNMGSAVSLSGGNLQYTTSSNGEVISNIAIVGKKYWEVTIGSVNFNGVGISGSGRVTASNYPGDVGQLSYQSNGVFRYNNTTGYAPAAYTTGDVIGIAVDIGSAVVTFYKNNVSQGSGPGFSQATPAPIYALVGGSSVNSGTCNFGASPFVYAPPTGFDAGIF